MKSAQVVMAACHPVIHDEDEMIWHFVSNSHKVMTALIVVCLEKKLLLVL
jgi:hypothetical protein